MTLSISLNPSRVRSVKLDGEWLGTPDGVTLIDIPTDDGSWVRGIRVGTVEATYADIEGTTFGPRSAAETAVIEANMQQDEHETFVRQHRTDAATFAVRWRKQSGKCGECHEPMDPDSRVHFDGKALVHGYFPCSPFRHLF